MKHSAFSFVILTARLTFTRPAHAPPFYWITLLDLLAMELIQALKEKYLKMC